jgi:hypothetical protein
MLLGRQRADADASRVYKHDAVLIHEARVSCTNGEVAGIRERESESK